jgi:long-chain acyl-CoA synthetase
MAKNTAQLPKQAANLNALIDTARAEYAGHNALGMALEEPITYQELHDRICVLAARLRKDGVRFADRVALLAENSHNWGTVYFAAVRLGAVCVPILPDLPEADVRNILTEMECGVIFTSKRQISKVIDLDRKINLMVTLDDYHQSAGTGRNNVLPFTDFLSEAKAEFADALKNGSLRFPEVESDHPASILYTSGTSGFSKAVILSHGNLCSNAAAAAGAITLQPEAVFLSVLPVAHTYKFTVGLLMPLLKGACVLYTDKTPTPAVLKKLCRHERPHVMLIVPLIIEKIYKKQVVSTVKKSRLLSFLCRFSLGRKLVYRRVGGKLATFFGGRLKMLAVGGAALNPEVEDFLRDSGLPFLVGYGMTEASPLISGGPAGDRSIQPGSAGRPIAGVEVRIDAPDSKTGIGEILARGPNIMQGYWNNPEETAKTVDEQGWLHTGDLGCFDDQGNLHIKGRSKSVIVLASGENVYPEAVEHKLNNYSLTADSLVVERNRVLEALIHPDYDFVDEQMRGKSGEERQAYILAELERIRKDVNGQVGAMSRLTKIVEQRDPFVKTATHKIKRYLYAEGC